MARLGPKRAKRPKKLSEHPPWVALRRDRSLYDPRIMARTEAWKLVFYPGEPYGELYHLEEDPDELYNLYDDPAHAGARGEMVERMMDWYGKTRMQR